VARLFKSSKKKIIGQKRKGLEKKEQEVKKNIIPDKVVSIDNKDEAADMLDNPAPLLV
jgi:hypothetical protein